jgi:hypothetical protein
MIKKYPRKFRLGRDSKTSKVYSTTRMRTVLVEPGPVFQPEANQTKRKKNQNQHQTMDADHTVTLLDAAMHLRLLNRPANTAKMSWSDSAHNHTAC